MSRNGDEEEDRRARNRSRRGILAVLALVVAVFVATMAYGVWTLTQMESITGSSS